MADLVIRPLTAGEEALFDALPDQALVGPAAFGARYRDIAARGNYRPAFTWVALRDGVVVARAAWWSRPADAAPAVLDWFDFTDQEAAVELLRTAPGPAEFSLVLPPDWRDRPAVAQAAQARIAAAEAAGMALLVERYGYRWTPACGLPARPGRLVFTPEPDDNVIHNIFVRVHQGSLDAHAQHVTAVSGLDAAAAEDLQILRLMPGPREWWRTAFTADGELVGLTVPSRNFTDPVIGYIGVLPEQRGHGYAYDLLVEATHLLAAEGADRIIANTDVTNTPMAANFAKAGYPVTDRRIDLVG
ncbi:MAG TPA: GNAT family N-acetyltransferase [Trebonia sp.]|nr:GNAT family N-acetyltransferase [Trebonia sp.]